jgi:alkaline phosphatase
VRFPLSILFLIAASAPLCAQSGAPSLKIVLPERLRVLQGQYFDIVLEVRNASAISNLRVMAGNTDITSKFGAPQAAQLDCDASADLVVRADLQSLEQSGMVTITASATAGGTPVSHSRTVDVRSFNISTAGQRRNVILFIGDAMGVTYRDAARLVSRAITGPDGKPTFREGFFDDLLEMDKMPVSGMSMTHGTDSIVPDSANTGTAWATGNKSFLNAVNSFEDGTDCRWRFNGQANAANEPFILDNPRVENLWQYLKRRYGYRAGIVSTAAITDATPAVEGAYSGFRQTRFTIAMHYVENPMLGGRPAFEVIMGGGADPFTSAGRPDRRNLIGELQARGYRYVTTATELKTVRGPQPVIGLFKGSAAPAPAANGITTVSDVNMDVAYDKLRLPVPASEPLPNLGVWTDQPMLDLMTEKAIEVLSSAFGGAPFILMVEAASIDKQSHPNNAAKTIWDTIELDKAIGVARKWAAPRKDTLIVVTADHDQSMHLIGVNNTPDSEYFDRNKKVDINWTSARGNQSISVWGDSFSNARAGLPFINGSTGASNNSGTGGMPGTHTWTANAANPASNGYSTYFGSPLYPFDPATGYPTNVAQPGQVIRRLTVGFRTGDHTASSVPVTAEGPGAFLFMGYMDQSDIFFKMAAALSPELTAEGDKFVEWMQSNKNLPQSVGK